MDRLGISYKDAAHRLYMAECKKIQSLEQAVKGYAVLTDRCDEGIARLEKTLGLIGGGITHVDNSTQTDLSSLDTVMAT